MHIDAKVLNEIPSNQVPYHIKRITHYIQRGFIPRMVQHVQIKNMKQ